MNFYEPQKHQNHPKKRNHPNTSLFSPPILNLQQNRPHHHLQNTLPHHQKAPQLKRTQNDEKRSKTRVFSTFSLSPLPDNESSPNLRRNRTRNALLHPQKVLQVKRKQNNKNRTQTPHSPHISHISPSSLPDNEKRRNLHWNRRRSDPLHPQKVPQLNRNEKGRKNCPKRRQLTPYSPTMDPTTCAQIRNLVLELKAISDEKIELYKGMAKILGEMRADLKAKGMTANSTSNIIIPVHHPPSPPSPPSPTTHQPSYTSISTQTTPSVVHRPSYTSVSIQTETLQVAASDIIEIASPVSASADMPSPPMPHSPPPPPSFLGLIPTPLPPLLPTSFLTPVTVPATEPPLGSTTPSRQPTSFNKLETLQPQPYPPSRLRPQPEPSPGST